MILFNHMFVCYFFPRERKEKTDNPLTIPISSSVCGTMVTPASYSGRVGHPRYNPQTSPTLTDYIISCHFLCRLAWLVFVSWFCIFADSRGIVTFCNIRFWFRLWGYTHFPLSFIPVWPLLCDLFPPSLEDGWMLLLPVTLSPWSLVSSLSHTSHTPSVLSQSPFLFSYMPSCFGRLPLYLDHFSSFLADF